MEIKGTRILPQPLVQNTGVEKKMPRDKEAESFQDILLRELAAARQIKISAHARKRLQERKITLTGKDLDNIAQALNRAGSKGIRDSLIIYGDLAMVASINNRTIVTAMHNEDASEKIFTNIDGAMFVKKN